MATATTHVQCPACETVVPVQINSRIVNVDDRQELICTPDMTDLWAHAWSHDA